MILSIFRDNFPNRLFLWTRKKIMGLKENKLNRNYFSFVFEINIFFLKFKLFQIILRTRKKNTKRVFNKHIQIDYACLRFRTIFEVALLNGSLLRTPAHTSFPINSKSVKVFPCCSQCAAGGIIAIYVLELWAFTLCAHRIFLSCKLCK